MRTTILTAVLGGVLAITQLPARCDDFPVIEETARLETTDLSQFAGFGFSLNIDGDLAIIGAAADDNSNVFRAGAAFVFERQADGTWLQSAKLLPRNGGDTCSKFGISVDIQGSIAVVGQYRTALFSFPPLDCPPPTSPGAAYVFEKQGSDWIEVAQLSPPPGTPPRRFGASVALDGETVIVSARGGAQIFKREPGGAWRPGAFLRSSDPDPEALPPDSEVFGDTEDVDIFGNVSIISHTRPGYPFTDIYEAGPDGAWHLVAALNTAGFVQLAHDIALIGLTLHERDASGVWTQTASLIAAGPPGAALASAGDVNSSGVAAVRWLAGGGGAAFFQRWPDGSWHQTAVTSPFSNNAMAMDDRHAVLGGGGAPGAAAIFELADLPAVATVIMEAESMFLSQGYSIEPGEGRIFIADTANNPTGYSHLSFPGGPGTYQIEVQLVGGGTGLSVVEFYLNGERLGYQYFDFSTENPKLVLPSVTMLGGDDIILAGNAEGDGGARVDRILFTPE